jgi:hypothetical protein
MNTGTFMDLISINYDSIKSTFKIRLYNIGMSFDEDSFNDAFIKCAQKFGNTEISYDCMIKYFWVTYVNTIKTNISKEHKIEVTSLDVEIHDVIDDDDCYIYELYDKLMNDISKEFGKETMAIYSLYKFNNYTKEQIIECGYDCEYFEETITEIDTFIKNKYKHKHKHSSKTK